MAKCKVLLEMLEEYKKKYKGKEPVFEEGIGLELHFLPYEEQLNFKKEYISRLLKNRGFSVKVDKISPSPVLSGYRNKMEYSFGDLEIGGELNLGLHVPGRYYDIESSTDLHIVDDDFNSLVLNVQEYCRKKGYEKFHKRHASGLLRNFIVRKGRFTGEILIGISTTYSDFDEEDFIRFVRSIDLEGQIVGIIRLKNDSTADVVKAGEDDTLLWGRDYYIEKILGLEFKVSFFSFFQTNSACTEILYTRIRENVKALAPKKALDLFCGTGTISQVLAHEVEELVGIEIVEDAVKMANENAAANGIKNCKYIAGDVFKVLKEADFAEDIDLVIVDPPRSGISKKALDKIIELGVDDILYVSCNPRTFAIDYEALNEAGYEIKNIEGVDQYPMTKHVETISLLSKLKSSERINVEIDLDEADLTSTESKATYQQIKDYVLDNTGLKVSSLNIAQIKRKCGIIERKNYNISKNEDSKVPNCTEEKEKAIKDALRYFMMI